MAAGDVIAVLDSDDLEAAVRRAQASLIEATARLADARREEARQRRIVEAGVAPSADLDAAVTQLQVTRAQLGTARANLESIEAQLAYTVIHAPVNGVVIERTVEVGEMVAPGGFYQPAGHRRARADRRSDLARGRGGHQRELHRADPARPARRRSRSTPCRTTSTTAPCGRSCRPPTGNGRWSRSRSRSTTGTHAWCRT